MVCPACNKSLKSVPAGNQKIEVCAEGCGGVWLERVRDDDFDAAADAAAQSLADTSEAPPPNAEPSKRRVCPKCRLVVMMRHFFSIKKEAEIDKCGGCGGIWIDASALQAIRNQPVSAAQRLRETRAFYAQAFQSFLSKKQK